MKRLITTIFLLMTPMIGWSQTDQGVPASAVPDSVKAPLSYWGEIPARQDSNTAHFSEDSCSPWETSALVFYNVLGIPFRILGTVGSESINTLDRWGMFDMEPAEHPGLLLPYNIYLLPKFRMSGLEGATYGLTAQRPDFLGPGNMAYLLAITSSRHADKLSGGFYFHLDECWGLELGAGSSAIPLTKYYGLGHSSAGGDLSYYNRISNWFGAEVDRELGKNISVEIQSYFSQVQTKEPGFQVDEGLGSIHAGSFPFGFPGESSGWTFRMGLIRDATSETGRPQDHGFQKASVALFQASDDSELSFLQYALDVQQFVPLWFTQRTLALRGFFTHLQNLGTGEVPFSRMTSMYHPNNLRGFTDLRFYGLGSVGLSAEYRWPLWVAKGRRQMGFDSYVFSDIGQVYEDTDEIALTHFNYTGGVGLRVINSGGNYMARFELGFSHEETVVTLTFSQNFQHHGRSLLYGKDPTRRP